MIKVTVNFFSYFFWPQKKLKTKQELEGMTQQLFWHTIYERETLKWRKWHNKGEQIWHNFKAFGISVANNKGLFKHYIFGVVGT